jgi:large subunit ribosomal protein L13
MAKPSDIDKQWYIVDVAGKTLGRVATEIATILRGKHKPEFTPHMDTGDFVIVINAEKIELTGRKWEQKELQRYSGYPGGLKRIKYSEVLEKNPEIIIRKAVKGMLPKNKLGRKTIRKLKVYSGADHPHQAQQPEVWELRN